MKYHSIWEDDSDKKKYRKLKRNINVDVLIIGGGITGISTAYFLRNTKLKVAVVESNEIGRGVTAKSTGKITYLQGIIYSELCKTYNFEVAKEYYYSQDLAISLLRDIILTENIECNLDKVKSVVFTENSENIYKLKEEKEILEKFGLRVSDKVFSNELLNIKYMISVDNTYVFNPVKYLDKLAMICQKKKIKIFEHTRIINIKRRKRYICETKDGFKISCNQLVIACHYPYFLKPFFIPLKTRIEKSNLVSGRCNKIRNESYISEDGNKSMRYYNNGDNKYVVYLTNSDFVCNKLNEVKNYNKIVNDCNNMDVDISNYWRNDDLITIDNLPYIGRLENNNDNLFIGTGYNTWGMTNGTLAGYCLSNMIVNKENEFEKIFNPLRTNHFSNIDKVFVSSFDSVKGYIMNKIVKNKIWYSSNVYYGKIDDDNVAVYNDGEKEYIVYSKCPHLGCTLIFNEIERTWDCPCHASRFNLEGKCIKGPSNYDISYVKGDDDEI